MPQKLSYNWKKIKIWILEGLINSKLKHRKAEIQVYLGKLLTCMGDQEICAVSIMQQILRTWPTDFHWFRILFWNLFCLVYIKICLFVLFAYKYLRINFYPLVCCCVKLFMRARKSRRHTAEDSDKKGNFCCSKTGLLIAESGNMVSGTCNFGHVFFWTLDTILMFWRISKLIVCGGGRGLWRQKDLRIMKTLEGETVNLIILFGCIEVVYWVSVRKCRPSRDQLKNKFPSFFVHK